ncbi:MAG: methyltransferase [Pseudomonadales bacterium]
MISWPGASWFGALRRRFEARIADADFQSRAALHPVGRFFARPQARALFDLCAGFTYSQTLMACERLQLFDQLQDHPQTLEALATATATEPARLRALLQGATALRLLARTGDLYSIGSLGFALLGNPGVRAMIRHHHVLYQDLLEPTQLLTPSAGSSRLSEYWAYPETPAPDAQSVAQYSDLMAQSQRFIAEQVLAAVDFGSCKTVLDLGGGQGVFIEQLAQRYPHLQFILFDLPPVIDRARGYLRERGLLERVRCVPGDLFRDALPQGADLVSLVRVAHDHDTGPVSQLLSAVRALAPQRLLLAEPMAGAHAGGVEAYFSAYFLAMGQGQLRTPAELTALLGKAGFHSVRGAQTPIPMLAQVLIARPQ